MKLKYFTLAILAVLTTTFLLTFSSCVQDECSSTRTYQQWNPVYLTNAQIAQQITAEAPRALERPGKLYFYGTYILINELYEGIHVIDNSDPLNPQNVAFINIPGNVDMAVKDKVLYADNFVHLIAIDISDVHNPQTRHIETGVFNEGTHYYEDRGYIIGYEPTSVTEEVPCSDPRYGGGWFWREDVLFMGRGDFTFDNASVSANIGSAPSVGTGGSMARFTIYQDYLYTVDNNNLYTFDISAVETPSQINTTEVGWGIETIYPYEDKLFIGSNRGMFIFDNSNPTQPVELSSFAHVQSCDPVVVEGDRAYVTLRGGTRCRSISNQLDILDISDLTNPQLITTHLMDNPHGLAIDGTTLYLCDGASGLKVFDVEKDEKIKLLDKEEFNTYDVIALPGDLLLVIGSDGLYQYSASDKKNLRQLSVIPVE